ncbi:P-loop containing nucleoside triphosphate hydrolase protein [Hypomontagnella submonticulosa]|nr:P-loop containing nucleoside triphosphate hydrolase protein [Hypomontagnella submonticulosa]
MADSNYLQVPPIEYTDVKSTVKSQEFRVPISKSFSFVPPKSWKIKNPFLLEWIDKIPSEVNREQPLEPAHFQAPKHSLETVDLEEGQDGNDDHRHKRVKRGSFLSRRSSLQIQPATVDTPNRGLMRRVTSACHRIIHPTKRQDIVVGSAASEPSPSVKRHCMRFVFVGDTGCGKSSLLLRYHRGAFSSVHKKTKYEMFAKTVHVDGQEVDLELWDTSGDISLHQLQLISYLAWDAVFLCFSVDICGHLAYTQIKWIEEIRKNCNDAPIILVGLKKDKRVGSGMWAPTYRQLQAHIHATEESTASGIARAVKYIECSAKTGENVHRVFEEGVRMVLCDREEEDELAQTQKKQGDRESTSFSKLMCFK